MAAKTWEADFRFPAIQASIRALGDACEADPFAYPGSFCIPVAEKPVIGWTPGRVSLVVLVLGFVLLGSGALLATKADEDKPGAGDAALLTLAACCSLSGIAVLFVPAKLDRHIVRWLIGKRGRELLDRSGTTKVMAAELSDVNTSGKISIDGDDHVLILFDVENRRLQIEGIGARYQIRAADVEKLEPFGFMAYLGAEITCRIDSQTRLRIAIARVSMLRELIRQVPVLFFLRGTVSNRLLENCTRTLRRSGDSPIAVPT